MGPISVSDANNIYGLMAFLADPKACAARMEELKKQTQQAMDAQKAGEEASAKAEADRSRAEALVAQAATAARENQKTSQSLTARENEIKQAQDRNLGFAASLTKRENEVAARESAASKREQSVQARELAAKQAQDAAEVSRQTYETKLSQIRSLIPA